MAVGLVGKKCRWIGVAPGRDAVVVQPKTSRVLASSDKHSPNSPRGLAGKREALASGDPLVEAYGCAGSAILPSRLSWWGFGKRQPWGSCGQLYSRVLEVMGRSHPEAEGIGGICKGVLM